MLPSQVHAAAFRADAILVTICMFNPTAPSVCMVLNLGRIIGIFGFGFGQLINVVILVAVTAGCTSVQSITALAGSRRNDFGFVVVDVFSFFWNGWVGFFRNGRLGFHRQLINIVILVTVAAVLTGMQGVTLRGSGRRYGFHLIIMTSLSNLVCSIAVAASALVGGIALLGASRLGHGAGVGVDVFSFFGFGHFGNERLCFLRQLCELFTFYGFANRARALFQPIFLRCSFLDNDPASDCWQ